VHLDATDRVIVLRCPEVAGIERDELDCDGNELKFTEAA
jgi:hypothetical protein